MSSQGDLINELEFMTMSSKSKKQTAAQKRNFSIFRLRGILSSLDSIAVYGYLKGDAASELVHAKIHVRTALIAETGK